MSVYLYTQIGRLVPERKKYCFRGILWRIIIDVCLCACLHASTPACMQGDGELLDCRKAPQALHWATTYVALRSTEMET